jgi:hypothetical protein
VEVRCHPIYTDFSRIFFYTTTEKDIIFGESELTLFSSGEQTKTGIFVKRGKGHV